MAGAPAGYDVFLSYSRADAVAAETLRTHLRDAGLSAFLDRYALPAGRPWQPALETALTSCRTLVVLLGPAGIGSWQHREIQLGLDRRNAAPVVPVLLPGLQPDDLPLGTFLGLNTWVDLRQGLDEPEALQRLLAAAQGQAIDGLTRDLAGLRPYRGLLAFREQDARLFFGRKRFAKELLAKARQRSSSNVVAVLGRSGSGKSSIVFAGLFPALRKEKGAGQQAVWNIASLRPGGRPLQALIETFDPADPALGETETLALLNRRADLLRKGEVTLAQLIDRRIEKDKGTTRQLLYVDQWEELYTQAQKREPTTDEDKARAADARLFTDLVLDAAATSPCTLVLSVRSDFYPDIQTHDRLRAAVQDCQVSLGPMTKAELTAAIEGPAKAVSGSVEPELTRKLLRDIGLVATPSGSDEYDIGKLPLLEYALEQAWTKATDGRVGLADYAGLEQALEDRANEIYNRLQWERRAAAKRLFVSLVNPEGREDTRARIIVGRNSDLGSVAEAFAAGDARLVVTGDEAGARAIEISHEALIRHWNRLRVWIDENRRNLRIRARLAADRDEWLRHGRSPTLLVPPGRRLEAALALRDQPGDVEIKDLRDYIEASEAAVIAAKETAEAARTAEHRRELEAARQIAEQQRQRADAERRAAHEQRQRADAESARARTLRLTVAMVATAAIISAGFASYAWYAKGQVQQEADKTTAALIWARLDFDGSNDPKGPAPVEALWELAGANMGVRDAFLSQLASRRYQVDTLAAGPASIGRALGLLPPADTIQRLLDPILGAISRTTDLDQQEALALAAITLAPKSSPELAQGSLDYVLGTIERYPNASSLLSSTILIHTLGPTSEQVEITLRSLLDILIKTTDNRELSALATAVQVLGPDLSPEQSQAALSLVLNAIRQTKSPSAVFALTRAVYVLDPRPDQVQVALRHILDIVHDTSDSLMLSNLVWAVGALGPTLSPEQARVALDQILEAVGKFIKTIRSSATAEIIQAIALRLSPEQARVTRSLLLDSFEKVSDPYVLVAFAMGLRALGAEPEQAQFALDRILSVLQKRSDDDKIDVLAMAVQILGSKLSPERVQDALGLILDALRHNTSPDAIRDLAVAVQSLEPRLSPQDAQRAFSSVLETFLQIQWRDARGGLAQTMEVVAPKLKPEYAQAALGPVLDETLRPADDDLHQVLSRAIQSLGATAEQAQAALGPMLNNISLATEPLHLIAVAAAVQGLGPMLPSEQAKHVIELMQSVLAATDVPKVSEALARAIAVTLPLDIDQPGAYVAEIVELLKWPTTAGPATDALLEVLHDRVPGAPGKEAGLDATVQWVAARFPEIDLDSPPTPPASVTTGAAW